jgi:putative peptidoglycan lipid II flippase
MRDIIFAHFLGAGAAADAFVLAFKLPNLFRRLTAEGALTNAFLPAYSLARKQAGTDKALVLATEVQGWLFLSLSLIVLVMELSMGSIISVLAPGFSDDDFVGGAAAPVILNICLIAGALMIPASQSYYGYSDAYLAVPIAFCVLLAGMMQMILLQYRLARLRRRPAFRFMRLSKQGLAMWGAFLPAALGAGGMQLNLLVDLVLASFLDTGALSWLYYADRLAQLPLGIIGIALGTALLPRLSSIYADSSPQAEKQAQFASHISDSLTLAAITVLPAMTGLIILSDELMAGLFVSGAFTASDGSAAGLALVAYGVGLPAFVGIKITQAALYAMTRPQLVLIISLFSVGINIVLSLYLMRILGHVGLALATSISIWLSWAIQSVILFRQRYLDSQPLGLIVKACCASLVMAAGLYGIMISGLLTETGALITMLVLVISGIMFYIAAALLFGLHHPFKAIAKDR